MSHTKCQRAQAPPLGRRALLAAVALAAASLALASDAGEGGAGAAPAASEPLLPPPVPPPEAPPPEHRHRLVVAIPTYSRNWNMVAEGAKTWRESIRAVVVSNGTWGTEERRIDPPPGVNDVHEIWREISLLPQPSALHPRFVPCIPEWAARPYLC